MRFPATDRSTEPPSAVPPSPPLPLEPVPPFPPTPRAEALIAAVVVVPPLASMLANPPVPAPPAPPVVPLPPTGVRLSGHRSCRSRPPPPAGQVDLKSPPAPRACDRGQPLLRKPFAGPRHRDKNDSIRAVGRAAIQAMCRHPNGSKFRQLLRPGAPDRCAAPPAIAGARENRAP